jgi:hypothetical protein
MEIVLSGINRATRKLGNREIQDSKKNKEILRWCGKIALRKKLPNQSFLTFGLLWSASFLPQQRHPEHRPAAQADEFLRKRF